MYPDGAIHMTVKRGKQRNGVLSNNERLAVSVVWGVRFVATVEGGKRGGVVVELKTSLTQNKGDGRGTMGGGGGKPDDLPFTTTLTSKQRVVVQEVGVQAHSPAVGDLLVVGRVRKGVRKELSVGECVRHTREQNRNL